MYNIRSVRSVFLNSFEIVRGKVSDLQQKCSYSRQTFCHSVNLSMNNGEKAKKINREVIMRINCYIYWYSQVFRFFERLLYKFSFFHIISNKIQIGMLNTKISSFISHIRVYIVVFFNFIQTNGLIFLVLSCCWFTLILYIQ